MASRSNKLVILAFTFYFVSQLVQNLGVVAGYHLVGISSQILNISCTGEEKNRFGIQDVTFVHGVVSGAAGACGYDSGHHTLILVVSRHLDSSR